MWVSGQGVNLPWAGQNRKYATKHGEVIFCFGKMSGILISGRELREGRKRERGMGSGDYTLTEGNICQRKYARGGDSFDAKQEAADEYVSTYNLAEGDYLVLGEGRITVNGEEAENGSLLRKPGEYVITVTGAGAYRRRIRLCREEQYHAAFSGKKDVMPIAGFYGPYRAFDEKRGRAYDYIREDIYEKIRDLGINLILFNDNDYTTNGKDITDDLAYASRYGIGVYIHDQRLQEASDHRERAAYLSEYAGYSAFRGIALTDEPFTPYYDERLRKEGGGTCSHYEADPKRRMESYENLSAYLNRFCNLCGNINLLPMIAYLGGEDYREDYDRYLEDYIRICRPKVLSFDYYVFAGNYAKEHGREGYFANMAIVREKTLKYGLAFWNFIQIGANSNDAAEDMAPTENTVPSRGQLLWNINTSLAYGARGIEYFTLIQPYYYAYEAGGGYDYGRNGLIGADGTVNKWFADTKYGNAQIAAVDEFLMHCQSREILAAGVNAQKWTGIEKSSSEEAGIAGLSCGNLEEGLIAGVFRYGGQTAVYLVNNDTENPQFIAVIMKRQTCIREIRIGQDNRRRTVNYCKELEPGGAVLLLYEA